ncbi:hypothetical protein [Eisenibacter elegans]|uniref:hypothetical protein n=1 Tax=Eisenibacter elegans TaxID=997 RepID=UPI000426A774|nr:hypothetical protein [Eisenibacter elegans]
MNVCLLSLLSLLTFWLGGDDTTKAALSTAAYHYSTATEAKPRPYQFVFRAKNEDDRVEVVVHYEVYLQEPMGFRGNTYGVTTLNSNAAISVNLDKNQNVAFRAEYRNNDKRVSMMVQRNIRDLNRKGVNEIELVFYDKKDENDYQTIGQMVERLRVEKYAQSLLKDNRNELTVDNELAVGTLIFFDGNASYYNPSFGIVDGQEEEFNVQNYLIQDLVRIEKGFNAEADAKLGAFLRGVAAKLDVNNTSFMEYSISIKGLSKRRIKNYLKPPSAIFDNKNDRWLDAIYALMDKNTERIPQYRLYFVTSKIMADSVLLRRRVFRQFNNDFQMVTKGVPFIEVGAGNRFYSTSSFEELDSFKDLYIGFEVLDLTLLLMNEYEKRVTQQQRTALQRQRTALEQQFKDAQTRITENFALLKGFDDELVLENPSYNQMQTLYANRTPRAERNLPMDSLGKEIEDQEILRFNQRVRLYNQFLEALKTELHAAKNLEQQKRSIDVLISQLESKKIVADPEAAAEAGPLQDHVLKNIQKSPPK